MNLIVLLVFAFGHFAADLASGLAGNGQMNFSSLAPGRLAMLYNLLAFGIQPLLGYGIDRLRCSKGAAVAGCLLMLGALLLADLPREAVILAGMGNALFHLGGGVAILRLFPGKAWPLGVFVGPGALGIALSRSLGADYAVNVSSVFMLLFFVTILILTIRYKPEVPSGPASPRITGAAALVILLLFASTFIRSLVGLSLAFPWKVNTLLGTLLVVSAALGKMLGGWWADRGGRIRAPVLGLLLAAPLLAWGGQLPYAGVLGMLLFQSTMAITLLAIYEQLPDYPALAFGVLCFGLWLGYPASHLASRVLSLSPWAFLCLVLASCLAIWAGLKLGAQKQQAAEGEKELEE